jgi:hypothetical protein
MLPSAALAPRARPTGGQSAHASVPSYGDRTRDGSKYVHCSPVSYAVAESPGLGSPTSKRGLDAQALPALPMREAAFTPTVASLHPPTTVLSPESQPVVDVDRLVELIAARMDRSARPDSGLPPPQYQLR